MLRRLYTDPAAPSSFSSLRKLQQAVATSKQIETPAAALSIPHKLRKVAVSHAPSKRTKLKQKRPSQIKAWLETQDTYTLHRPLRKRFPRNPYTVNNIDVVWEIDILNLTSLKKYNNNYRYLLQVIDAFSKYLHGVPLRTKTGKEVAVALEYTKLIRKRPVWVRTDKGKEFLNTQFQTLLKREGIEFQVCRNTDVKCAVVERVNRNLRDKLHRYFTYKNTYKYIDVLPKFVKGYNATVHSTTGMAPTDMSDTDVLTIWNKMQGKAGKTAFKQAKISGRRARAHQ